MNVRELIDELYGLPPEVAGVVVWEDMEVMGSCFADGDLRIIKINIRKNDEGKMAVFLDSKEG